jgi:hypothetical protein
VALLLGGAALWYSQLVALDHEAAELTAAKTDLDGQLAVLEDDDKRIKALTEWTESEVVWLDELYDLTDRFPDSNNLRLVQLTGEPMARTAKSKYIGKLALKGVATADPKPIDRLMENLAKDSPHLRVEPKFLSPNVGQDRFLYPQQFTSKVDLERLPPTKYVRRIPEPDPLDRRNPGQQGNPMDFGFFGVGQ